MTGLFDLTDLSGVQPTGSSARMNISSAVNIAIDIVNNCECAATSLTEYEQQSSTACKYYGRLLTVVPISLFLPILEYVQELHTVVSVVFHCRTLQLHCARDASVRPT